MRTLSVLLLLLVQVLGARAHAQDYPRFDVSRAGTPIDLSDYTLVWADEFLTLMASVPNRGPGHWFTGVHAVLAQGEKMAHVPDPAYAIESGVLVMRTRVDPADGKRVEAHLQTNNASKNTVEFQNGYLEARMWVPAAKGSHAGLWLLSVEKGFGHTEVDVVETYGVGDASVHSATHIWPIAPAVHKYSSKRVVKADIFDGFHLYGVQAMDHEFVFYYDRVEISRVQRIPDQRVPLYLLLSVFGNPTQPLIEQPATMRVDYIRIYTPKKTPHPPVLLEPVRQ